MQYLWSYKASELLRRHNIKKKTEDFDIFFCDTEGISSLDGMKKETIPGILTLLQISTISIFMVQKNCKMNNLKEICSQIQISRCLKQINEENNKNKNDKEFPTPKIGVYISNIFTGSEINGDCEEDEEDIDLDSMKNKYNESRDAEKVRIFNAIKEKYPNLNIEMKDFDVIPGGPFDNSSNKEPDHENINAQLFWWSINELLKKLFFIQRKKMNSKEIIDMMKFLFDIFQGVESLNNDFNLEEFLKTYLTQKFESYSKNKFKEKLLKLKNEIKTKFLEYLDIINDKEKAKNSLNECFDQNINLYKKLIGDKVDSFIELSIEIYQKKIKEQIDKEFQSICNYILSNENINLVIKDVVEMIKIAEFKEDIEIDRVKNIEIFWNLIYEKNKIILDYFKENKPNILNNLKENFISQINKIFRSLLKNKIEWSIYSKNIIDIIQKEINKIYLDSLNNCNYQEDFDVIKKPQDFFNEIFHIFKEKYLKNISLNRLNEISERLKKVLKYEYENIRKKRRPL